MKRHTTDGGIYSAQTPLNPENGGQQSQMYYADAWLPVITTVIIGCILPMTLLIGNEFA